MIERKRGIGWEPIGLIADAPNPAESGDPDLNVNQNNAAGDVPTAPNMKTSRNNSETVQIPQPSPPVPGPANHYNLGRRGYRN